MQEVFSFLKEAAPVGAVIVFAWGIYSYYRSAELTFRKPYWEKLLALYVEACNATATLARTDQNADWHMSKDAFWRLYYGALCLVESREVEAAMVEYGHALEGATFESRNRKELETRSLALAYACRDSIRSDWKVPLETLGGQKQV